MNELSDLMRNGDFIKIFTKMESQGAEKGLIYIEDATDRYFWESIIDRALPGRYQIKPYSQPGSEGKRRLEKEYKNLNPFYLVAVDADYDYLCPEKNEYSVTLNNSPFVLHTFLHSKESYVHTHEAITALTNSIHLHTPTAHQIDLALVRISNEIFEALCLFSFLHNQDSDRFKENTFNASIKKPDGLKILNDDMTVNDEAIRQIGLSAAQYITEHLQYVETSAIYQEHKAKISSKGITPDNAILFTNGHALLDNIFQPLYKEFIKKSKKNDLAYVNDNYPEETTGDRRRAVDNYYKNHCHSSTLINRCNTFLTSPFCLRISEKLTAIHE